MTDNSVSTFGHVVAKEGVASVNVLVDMQDSCIYMYSRCRYTKGVKSRQNLGARGVAPSIVHIFHPIILECTIHMIQPILWNIFTFHICPSRIVNDTASRKS